MTDAPETSAFDKLPAKRQIELITYMSNKYAWSDERAGIELRSLNHVGIAYIRVEMKLENRSLSAHSSDYDPMAEMRGS